MRLRAWLAKVLRTLGPLCVGAGLIVDGFELGYAPLEHRIGHVSDSVFEGVVKPLELGTCFGRTLAQFGDVRRWALGALLPAVEHTRQDLLETFGLQEALLDVLGDHAVELFHRNGSSLAAGLALTRLGAAGVILVSPALAGPQRHCSAARGAKADAGEQGRSAGDARRGQCWAARLEQRLHGLKLGRVDDRRHGHLDYLGFWLSFACFPKLGF